MEQAKPSGLFAAKGGKIPATGNERLQFDPLSNAFRELEELLTYERQRASLEFERALSEELAALEIEESDC